MLVPYISLISRYIKTAVAIFLVATHLQAFAANLFVYSTPNGERVVTDRPINLPGYELERHNLSAIDAGQSLRYQNTEENRRKIDQHINNAAYLYNVEADLIRAVIRQESAFKIDAISHKGAQGLMQLMPATARQYQVNDVFDPKQNIYAGTRHLSYLINQYNDLDLALAAYNAGEGSVRRYNGVPPFPETQDYIVKVRRWYVEYASQ